MRFLLHLSTIEKIYRKTNANYEIIYMITKLFNLFLSICLGVEGIHI